MELNKAEYTILAQVKIRLKQFHIETVTNEDDTTKDVVVFDNKEDDLLIEQLIKQATEDVKNKRNYPDSYTEEMITKDFGVDDKEIIDAVRYHTTGRPCMTMLDKIIEAVRGAQKIYKSAHGDLGIKTKGSAVDLVTEYDGKIQEYLCRELSKIIPGCSFLGEEGSENKELSDGYCFIIDPIDGTTNFVKGFQHSAISVGLAKDRELIAGVVLDPDLDNLFYAEKGKGAYLNGNPIHVSNCDLQHSLVLFGPCPYEHELAKKTFALTEEIFYNCLEVRRAGSAALDICYVAAGKADLYYELILRPWDLAGATVILREAGGICKTIDGGEIDLTKIQSYVCSGGNNLDEFFERANGILQL